LDARAVFFRSISNEIQRNSIIEDSLDFMNKTICHLAPLIYYMFIAGIMLGWRRFAVKSPAARISAPFSALDLGDPSSPQRFEEAALAARSFEDRLSSDKTLPRYCVRTFLYSAMIRGFSLGPASA
jgi:hypothetical protein